MEAIKRIITIKDNLIAFDELKRYNNREVEIIILPLDFEAPDKKQKENLLKFSGAVETNFTDTSMKVDELIYG